MLLPHESFLKKPSPPVLLLYIDGKWSNVVIFENNWQLEGKTGDFGNLTQIMDPQHPPPPHHTHKHPMLFVSSRTVMVFSWSFSVTAPSQKAPPIAWSACRKCGPAMTSDVHGYSVTSAKGIGPFLSNPQRRPSPPHYYRPPVKTVQIGRHINRVKRSSIFSFNPEWLDDFTKDAEPWEEGRKGVRKGVLRITYVPCSKTALCKYMHTLLKKHIST